MSLAALALEMDDSLAERLRATGGGAPAACFQCGTCTATCPLLSELGEPYSARRLLRSAQLGARAQGDGAAAGPAPQDRADIWLCTACRLCESRCPRNVNIVEAIMGLRTAAFEDGRAPPEFHKLLWSTLEEGNPFGSARSARGAWADGLGIPEAKPGEAKVLLYTGCAASYDPRLQKAARSLAGTLQAAGTPITTLGNAEACCGDAVRSTGERAWLERLVAQNVKAFNASGAQTLITFSPHCYDIFRNLYPRYGLQAEVLHATQYLERLLDQGKLPRPARTEKTVAYHDPCYLGRHNGVFETPRRLLESVPGLELVEFKDNRQNALCCGGGGGGMWRKESGARLSDKRHAQARETGAGLLATSCPYCVQNFEDGTKRFGGPAVVDVVELLRPQGAA